MTIYESLSFISVAAVLFGAAWAVAYVIGRRRARLPLLELEPAAPVPWTILDAMIMLGLLVLINSALYVAAIQSGALPTSLPANASPEQLATTIFLFSLSCLGALIITLMLVPLRTRATLGELGFDKHTVRRDIAIGTTAFFVLVVPVLLLQLILTLLWKETSHPLVGLLRDDPSFKFFAMSGFAAVLVAPLVEEFFFRVLLQGWLETTFYRHSAAAQSIAAQADVAQPDASQQVTDSELSTNEDQVEPDEEANPYRSPTVAAQDHQPESGASPESGIINNPSPWAIVISAFLFAIAHGGNGPDPIPLFLFGLGLGYVYQRTHRLLPCLVVHMMLNALTLFQLWLYVHDS